jgi:hypothetical protein
MAHLTSEVEAVFSNLQGQNSHLHAYWRAFKNLFRGNERLVPIFNDTAPDFFVLVEKAFLGTILQIFRRVTDPAVNRSTSSRNASLKGLLFTVYGHDFEIAAPELSRMAALLGEQVKSIRHFVNRSVAHSDWNIVSRVEALQSVSMQQVEDALITLEQFLDMFAEELELSRYDYDDARMDAEISRMMELLSRTKASLLSASESS